jgi:hypothetical protein
MAEATVTTATTTTEAVVPVVEESIISKADQPIVSEGESVLDTAGAEEKAAREAEDKRIMEADEKTLKPEEVTYKAELVKAKQDATDKQAAEIRAKGVPEKYDIKTPEGLTLDETALTKVTPVFKELGITNLQAQGLVNYFGQVMKDQTAIQEATFKNWNEGNVKETMSALGANSKIELAYVAKVKNMFSPETIEALNASGIGNLKSFILDMAKVGKLFSEEHLVNDRTTRRPSTSGGTNEEIAEKFYPNMNK